MTMSCVRMAFVVSLSCAVGAIGTSTLQQPVVGDPASDCRDVRQCASQGDAALQRGDFAGALRSFRSQLQHAEDARESRQHSRVLQ